MGTYLTVPVTDKDAFDGENDKIRFGGCHMQGWRTSQEDAALHDEALDAGLQLFAVFDGHGSNEVAEYARDNLGKFIKESSSYASKDYKQAFADACKRIDQSLKTPEGQQELLKYSTEMSASYDIKISMSRQSEYPVVLPQEVGCTACMCLITPTSIICANLGDSRAVLGIQEGD